MRQMLLLLLLVPGLAWSAPDYYQCTVNGQKVFQKHPCRFERPKPEPKKKEPATSTTVQSDDDGGQITSQAYVDCLGRGLATLMKGGLQTREEAQSLVVWICRKNPNNFR